MCLLCHLLKCFRSLLDKQWRPRSDCSCRSSLIWVNTVCFYTYISQIILAKICSRQHKQTQKAFSEVGFAGALRVNTKLHFQGLHRLEKYLTLEGFLEKSLKIKFVLKSTGKSLKSLEKSLNFTIFCRTQHC